MTRDLLPQRRAADTISFTHYNASGQPFGYRATIGYYEDGRIGEVFLSQDKITTDLDIHARDSAILLSIALQHGADPAAMRAAMTRDEIGRPQGVIGTLLDLLCQPAALVKEAE